MSDLCRLTLLLVLTLWQGKATPAPKQVPSDYAARRAHALELYNAQKHMEALPFLEVLHAEKPDDVSVLEALAFDVLSHAATLDDPEARRKERVRGRQLAEEAKALGDNSNLLQFLLDVDPDGTEKGFSSRAEVETAMKQGEAAYAKSDFGTALAAYTRALQLDPKQYFAALFIGDVHFVRHEYELANDFFRRAVEIDPNVETAYRYWGDSLAAQGKSDEARERFIGAIVADPYNSHSWVGLSQWAPKHHLVLGHPAIQPQGTIEDKGKDDKGRGQTNITLDPGMLDPKAKKDGTNAWFSYTLFRAPWHGEKFQKEFPSEKEYRHTLREEVEAYQGVVDRVREALKKKEIKNLDPQLASLVKLADGGLLESFVLISKADAGIARDYPAYRDTHRDKVRQYISEWIIHPAP